MRSYLIIFDSNDRGRGIYSYVSRLGTFNESAFMVDFVTYLYFIFLT